MTKALKVLVLLSAGVMSSGISYAQSQDEIVSTATRSNSDKASHVTNVEVLSRQDIERINATHFSEIVTRTSGVNFARNDGQEYLASIRSPILTGAGACGAFLMAQDGVALRSSGFCNVNELFEAATEFAERIEITKGPGSALYGSNALHGIVNVISPAANTNSGMFSVEAGANEFARIKLSKGWAGDTSGALVTASLTHEGGYRDASGYDQQKANLRHDYQGDLWDISSFLAVTNLNQETAGYVVGLDSYKDDDLALANPNPEAYRDARSIRVSSRFSRQMSETSRLQITPYARALDMEFLMHFLPGAPVEESSQKSIGVQSGLYLNEDSDFSVITGVDLEITKGELQQTQDAPTQGSAFLMATIPSGKQYDYDVSSLMAASFLHLDWTPMSNLAVNAGLRLEYIGYDYTNNMVSGRTDENGVPCGFGGCRYSRPESRKDNFTSLSPKLGVTYAFSPTQQAYVNASSGYRAPQVGELYRLQNDQIVADLDSVKLKNVEVGVLGDDGKLSYDISVYAMKKDNVIFRDSSSFNVDNGKTDHIGADIKLGYDVTSDISVRGNLGLARHRYAANITSGGVNLNGLDIDSAPRLYGGAQVTWSPGTKFHAELEWVHMGSYFLDPENSEKYEGHSYLNLRTEYNFNENLTASVRVMNLTNVAYAERADTTVFTGPRYFPGKPRSLYVEIQKSF